MIKENHLLNPKSSTNLPGGKAGKSFISSASYPDSYRERN
jgi:hypothetical protein